MTARVRVTRKDALVQASSGDAESVDSGTVYTGAARVYEVSGPLTMAYGEAPSYHSTTYCSIPMEAEGDEIARINDMVEILDHIDQAVRGRVFRITHVDSGGQLPVVRRLTLSGVDRHVRPSDPDIPADWLVD